MYETQIWRCTLLAYFHNLLRQLVRLWNLHAYRLGRAERECVCAKTILVFHVHQFRTTGSQPTGNNVLMGPSNSSNHIHTQLHQQPAAPSQPVTWQMWILFRFLLLICRRLHSLTEIKSTKKHFLSRKLIMHRATSVSESDFIPRTNHFIGIVEGSVIKNSDERRYERKGKHKSETIFQSQSNECSADVSDCIQNAVMCIGTRSRKEQLTRDTQDFLFP